MNLREVYEPIPHLHQKAGTKKLRPFEWELLGMVDGKKTAAELGVLLNLSEAVLEQTFTKLLQQELVQITELTWDEFVKRYSPAPVDASHQAAPLPVSSLPVPPPTTSLPPAEVLNLEEPPVEFTLKKSTPAKPSSVIPAAPDLKPAKIESKPELVTPVTEILAKPEPAAPAPLVLPVVVTNDTPELPLSMPPVPNARKLRALFEFIVEKGGGGTIGQLAVYRVVEAVPVELLKRNGIDSLNLGDPDREIRDEELWDALLTSTRSTLGTAYPA